MHAFRFSYAPSPRELGLFPKKRGLDRASKFGKFVMENKSMDPRSIDSSYGEEVLRISEHISES